MRGPRTTATTTAIAAALALAVSAPPAGAQDRPPPTPRPAPQESFTTDGPVTALAKRGNRLFLGGAFTRIGPITGGGVALDAFSGARDTRFPAVGGKVFAVVTDDAGGYYIAGRFQSVGGVARSNLAHVLADGSVDPAFAPKLDKQVLALAKSPTRLYAGGDFLFDGEVIRRRLLALDRATGVLVQGFNPGVDGTVEDLALDANRLFVSGRFRGISGQSRKALAAVDATTGALDATLDAPPDGSIDAMLVAYGRLYVGGAFEQIQGRSRSGLAAFDLATGELDKSFSPSTDGYVFGLATDGERVFVAGHFGQVGRSFNAQVASVDPATGEASQQFRLFVNTQDAYAMGVLGDRLYIGGAFTKVNEQARARLAAVNRVTGALDPAFDPDPDGDVYAVAISGTQIYAGGNFTSVPRIQAPGIAELNATTGDAVPFAAGVHGSVETLLLAGDRLVAGGDFDKAAGVRRRNLADFDVATGDLGSLDPAPDDAVQALARLGDRLFVGGLFERIGAQRHRGAAAVDLATGKTDPVFNPTPQRRRGAKKPARARFAFADVETLVATSKRLYIGGDIETNGKRPQGGLVALAPGNGALDRGFLPNIEADGGVNALLLRAGTLYVGGGFQRLYRTEKRRVRGKVRVRRFFREGLVALDATNGRIKQGFAADVPFGLDRLALSGDRLILGGSFGEAFRRRRDGLAAVDAATGKPSTAWTPQPSITDEERPTPVSAILADGDRVFVGGGFTTIGSRYQPRIAFLPSPE
jgi:hypothetical protein